MASQLQRLLTASLTVSVALLLLAGCGEDLQAADPRLEATCTPEPNEDDRCVQGSGVEVAAVHEGDACENGKWVVETTRLDGAVILSCRNIDLERVNELAATVAAEMGTLVSDTAQAEADVRQAVKTLEGLRRSRDAILKDNAAAAASNCDTFPDLPDSPDIGADYILQDLSQLESDSAQLRDDYALYQQAASASQPTNPPSDEAVVDAIAGAGNAVKTLRPQIESAKAEAEQIVAEEQASADATGC